MRETLVECQKCGHRFVVNLFEPGEAKRKGVPGYPVRCEKCSGADSPDPLAR